jgi:hypothetical protein
MLQLKLKKLAIIRDILWGRLEVGVVSLVGIGLHPYLHSVTLFATAIEVVLLKVESILSKSVSIREIVKLIRNIERIDSRSIQIGCVSGLFGRIESIVEI